MASNAICPITQEEFRDPVICVGDGQTYERTAVTEWFLTHNTSPMTGVVLHDRTLVTNYALRNLIQEVKDEPQSARPGGIRSPLQSPRNQKGARLIVQSPRGRTVVPLPKKAQSLTSQTVALARMIHDKLVVTITAPDQQNYNPAHVICVMDISGSMKELCTMGEQDNGFSRLDLVKHAMTTFIHALSETDMLSLVVFSDSMRVVIDKSLMTVSNKQRALDQVQSLQPDGWTNIWAGLKQAIDMSYTTPYVNTSIVLLTDGIPYGSLNTSQIIQAFNAYPRLNSVPITTVGFGYQLDVDLLVYIAFKGLGSYLYVPDISMMGTIFVNYIANILSKAGTFNVNGTIVNLQFGQTRTMILPPSDIITLSDHPVSETYQYPVNTLDQDIAENILTRHKFVDDLNKIVIIAKKNLTEAYNLAMLCYHAISSPDIKQDLYSDAMHEGQITKALDPEAYIKWGKLYLPMLLRAHQRQIKCNFKDASVANYGGTMFKHLSDIINSLYSGLPAPKPSSQTDRTQVIYTMASVNNDSNICFEGNGETDILHSEVDGALIYKSVKIRDVKPGDYLFTNFGLSFNQVKYVTKQTTTCMLCRDLQSKALVTPWHPVKIDGKWQFPASRTDLYSEPTLHENVTIYNFVLASVHTIEVSGKTYVTLGHGIQEDAAKHDYFGTNAIIQDLMNLPNDNGIIDLTNYKTIRDPKSQLVIGFTR